jgi:phosphoglycerate dehydrogenase-like enzyme
MARGFSRIHACVGPDDRARRLVSNILAATKRSVIHLDVAALPGHLQEVEVLLCDTAPRIDWGSARRLRLLQTMGSGVDALWPAIGLSPQVHVANVRGMHLPEMRDHVLALLLAFERELPRALDQQRVRQWRPFAAGSLHGKRLCVLGLGEVGRAIAVACAGLGMRVTGTRYEARPTPHVDDVREPDGFRSLLPEADYVVVALPLTARTRGLLDSTALALLRPSAVLIHLSRGGIVDEEALVRALRSGALRGAALDVFCEEPLPPQSRLWDAPGLIVTPHLAGFVRKYVERALGVFLANLDRLEQGQAPLTQVDRSREY